MCCGLTQIIPAFKVLTVNLYSDHCLHGAEGAFTNGYGIFNRLKKSINTRALPISCDKNLLEKIWEVWSVYGKMRSLGEYKVLRDVVIKLEVKVAQKNFLPPEIQKWVVS